jgi:hypothetical protein
LRESEALAAVPNQGDAELERLLLAELGAHRANRRVDHEHQVVALLVDPQAELAYAIQVVNLAFLLIHRCPLLAVVT